MNCRYIALINTSDPSGEWAALLALAPALRTLGMRPWPSAGPIALFVSEDTPVSATASGGVVIGRLFSSEGDQIELDAISDLPLGESPSRHLLDRYWGDYLLLQPAPDQSGRVDVLRDPSGGVECVFSIQDGKGFITSDISLATALGLFHKQIDWEFVEHALVYPYLKAQRTGLVDLQELLPGCSLHVRRDATTVAREWSPWSFVADGQRYKNPLEAADAVRQAVKMAVGALASAERSILVELSGGLDSAIVAACLRDVPARVICCTLVTPVPGADERMYAGQMANSLGVELKAEELRFDGARFRFATPPKAVEPRIGMLQQIVDETMTGVAISQGTTSFFSGGGGDTVFGFLSSAAPAADALKERGLRAAIVASIDLSAMHNCTLWKAGRLALQKLVRPAKMPWRADHSLLAPAMAAINPTPHPWLDLPELALPGDLERIVGLVASQAFRESAPRGLCLPLLSQPVVEACLRVPTWMCILGGRNRSVARSAFAGMLPEDVLNRRSKGSFTSYYGAIHQRSKGQIRSFLQEGHLMERGLLDRQAICAFFEARPVPRDTSFMRTFDLCMIENWIQNQI